MKNFAVVAAFSIAFLTPELAFARELQCDKALKICVTNDTRLHVGDKVGIINEESELQATAVVTGIKGEKRSLEIEERYSELSASSRVVLLLENDTADSKSTYQMAKALAEHEIGADLGYASVGAGGGLTGQEIGLRGGMRVAKKWMFIGRVSLLSVQGPVRIYTGQEFVSPQLKTMGYGLLGGGSYQTNPSRAFSLRTDLSVGIMHVQATLGGSADLNESYVGNTKFQNGINPNLRWSVAGVFTSGDWHFDGGFAISMVGRATIQALTVGAARDL